MTGHDDDAQWRRPAEGTPSLQRPDPPSGPPGEALGPGWSRATDPGPATYSGPPTAPPPPRGWRPPVVVQFPPPRALPPQDLSRLDETEQQARTITYGVAMVTGAIMLLLILVLCGRALF